MSVPLRLHLFGRESTIRPGWLTVGPGLTSSNFDPDLYNGYFSAGNNTTGQSRLRDGAGGWAATEGTGGQTMPLVGSMAVTWRVALGVIFLYFLISPSSLFYLDIKKNFYLTRGEIKSRRTATVRGAVSTGSEAMSSNVFCFHFKESWHHTPPTNSSLHIIPRTIHRFTKCSMLRVI